MLRRAPVQEERAAADPAPYGATSRADTAERIVVEDAPDRGEPTSPDEAPGAPARPTHARGRRVDGPGGSARFVHPLRLVHGVDEPVVAVMELEDVAVARGMERPIADVVVERPHRPAVRDDQDPLSGVRAGDALDGGEYARLVRLA